MLSRFPQITFILLTTSFLIHTSQAQNNIIVGSEDEWIYRDRVLKNDIADKSSFAVRPLMASVQDTSLQTGRYFYVIPSLENILRNKYFTLNALPLSLETQYHPQSYGFRNNGAFVSVKGMQQQLTAGVELSSKILDLRVSPELLWISNSKNYNAQSLHVLGGQSMLRLKAGKLMAISAGTQQLWWGPAVFNSLMMSNNAPGFPHLSLHSYKPIELPIGTIEFNIVGGQLKSTRGFPMENFNQSPVESALPGNENYKGFSADSILLTSQCSCLDFPLASTACCNTTRLIKTSRVILSNNSCQCSHPFSRTRRVGTTDSMRMQETGTS